MRVKLRKPSVCNKLANFYIECDQVPKSLDFHVSADDSKFSLGHSAVTSESLPPQPTPRLAALVSSSNAVSVEAGRIIKT
ncbi:hypothetical protein N7463_007422 [Penicillium fimorum]|uniref:Uncharacterized protein n=1 Tax=Penicillium fimorum TaxID=1882269 RepID=A0A9W9XWD8_9EURO|nr:hypothetical protein N7463_007422 [Penicillium fimorum]